MKILKSSQETQENLYETVDKTQFVEYYNYEELVKKVVNSYDETLILKLCEMGKRFAVIGQVLTQIIKDKSFPNKSNIIEKICTNFNKKISITYCYNLCMEQNERDLIPIFLRNSSYIDADLIYRMISFGDFYTIKNINLEKVNYTSRSFVTFTLENRAIDANTKIKVIQTLFEIGCKFDREYIEDAIATRETSIIDYMITVSPEEMIAENHLTMTISRRLESSIELIYSKIKKSKLSNRTLSVCVMYENFTLLKKCLADGVSPASNLIDECVETNRIDFLLEVLKYRYDYIASYPDIFSEAIKNNTKMIDILLENTNAEPTDASLASCIKIDSKELFEKLLRAGAKPEQNCLIDAIKINDSSWVRGVLENGTYHHQYYHDEDNWYFYPAIQNNNLEIVELLVNLTNIVPSAGAFLLATQSKNKKILELVIKANPPIFDWMVGEIEKMEYSENRKIAINYILKESKKSVDFLFNSFPLFSLYGGIVKRNCYELKHEFSMSTDPFDDVHNCDELSKYTKRKHYDEDEFKKIILEILESFKKEHTINIRLSEQTFNKILFNQVKFIKSKSMFYNFLNGISGIDRVVEENQKEIERWLLEMSTKTLMINNHENLFELALNIPKLIKMRKLEEENKVMKELHEKFPTPCKEKFAEINRLKKRLENSFNVNIKKIDLEDIELVDNNEEIKNIENQKASMEDSSLGELYGQMMKNLIVSKSTSDFEDKDEFVQDIVTHINFGVGNINPETIPVEIEHRKFLFKILEKKDPFGIIVGEQPYSGCCFKIGGAGDSSLLESFVNPDTGILVVYDAKNDFLAQSWIWLTKDKKSLVLDNVEFATKFKSSSEQLATERSSVRYLKKIFNQETNEPQKKSVDITEIIQQAYKEFAKIYKEKTGLNIFVGTGYDDLGLSKMNLERLHEWDFSTNYPKNERSPYTDASTVLRLANWYSAYTRTYS